MASLSKGLAAARRSRGAERVPPLHWMLTFVMHGEFREVIIFHKRRSQGTAMLSWSVVTL